ncbi:MAG TPA: sigma-54 dependent transcriptional regulator [Gemmatimonadaceae bacterium]|nr:sigma-54 dependent transcriptional regulator [Gemmatimonadaceae bacterium]
MSQRVLLVDDESAIRESFARQFSLLGYEGSTAEGAEAAMRMLHEFDPAIVITDIRMPGVSGLELLKWIRERAPEIDVIVITAHQDMQTALGAMKAGAYDYLMKPLDLDQIELVLARCVRDRALRRKVRLLVGDDGEPRDRVGLVGSDPAMIEVSKMIASVAATRTPVLVRGDTGTGKEVVARTIHFNSPSADEPFVAVNCTAVPEPLLESELFGHLRGSFTGATTDRKGRFELAGTGTIFLDEIGDVSPAFQAKLLRVLQDGEFYPVGAERPRRTAARVIAATHRPLERLVREGAFREDLYFRLRVVEIRVPPLRERRGDIRLLAEAFAVRAARDLHKPAPVLPADTIRKLESYDWPGNVRELENTLTRALVLARTPVLSPDTIAIDAGQRLATAAPVAEDETLGAAVRAHVERVLAAHGGNKTQAARVLEISRQRLDRILNREDDDGAERNGGRNKA